MTETTTPKIVCRKVPGYYNHHTYRVEVDGKYLFDVDKTSDATWSRSACWTAVTRGTAWHLHTHDRRDDQRGEVISIGTTRAEAIANALRK
jgi:hypothetical protein